MLVKFLEGAYTILFWALQRWLEMTMVKEVSVVLLDWGGAGLNSSY